MFVLRVQYLVARRVQEPAAWSGLVWSSGKGTAGAGLGVTSESQGPGTGSTSEEIHVAPEGCVWGVGVVG